MLSPRSLTKTGSPAHSRTQARHPASLPQEACGSSTAGPAQAARRRSCQARHGTVTTRRGQARGGPRGPVAPHGPGPGPTHPSSAMALSVGAAPARLLAANTDTGRPGEWRRPPRSPPPARSRRDAPPAAGIQTRQAPAPSQLLTAAPPPAASEKGGRVFRPSLL